MIDLDKTPVAPMWLAQLAPNECALCGRTASFLGVWLVSPERTIIYGLCSLHAETQDVFQAEIEASITKSMQGVA